MEQNQELLDQLKKINSKLDIINHPIKNAYYNFIAGVFRSLGSLFGTMVIASLFIYLLSRFNFFNNFNNWSKSIINSVGFPSLSSPAPDQP